MGFKKVFVLQKDLTSLFIWERLDLMQYARQVDTVCV
jgi:hypothetical protein